MYNIEEIKSRISCIDYARQNGINVNAPGDRTYSPFHAGKNPTSFTCYGDSWYSFSDSIGGDVIDLCAFLHPGGGKGKAIADLAMQLGMRQEHQTQEWRDYMQELGNRIFFYNTQLTEDDYDYLHSRGVSDTTIADLKLGRNEEGRLVIPYWKNGYVAYFATRSRPGCKYPESKYRKMKIDDYNDHCVWGLNTLTRESDCLIIAEGAFDALAAYEQGYPVISAITGHFSSKQLTQALAACKQYPKVILTYDDDSATSNSGEKFTIKMAKILHQHKIPFEIAPMPRGFHDLSEYHAKGHKIADLKTMDGISYLVSTMEDIDELSAFINSIARYTTATKISHYLASAKIDPDTKKVLSKEAKNCPLETTIANEILQKHTLIYVKEDSFYEWNGKVWERIDEMVVMRYADEQYGVIFSTHQRTKQVMGKLKTMVLTECAFNHNPVFSFMNGTLELDTGIFREHRQSDYCSLILDYDYDPEARCPRWERFIDEITLENGQNGHVLQQIAGYVMYPNCKFQKIFCLIGAGANGKSVYLEMLEEVYSKGNCTHIPPAQMTNEFWLVNLRNSYLNFASEIDADFAKVESTIKMLSDGTTMQASYKGKNHISFTPRAKHVFACNAMPETRTIQGMERRMVFLDFPVQFVEYPDPENPRQRPRDINLKVQLQKELSGIFNWCYQGYLDLMRTDSFTDPTCQDEFIREFRENSNPVEIFVHECAEEFQGVMIRGDIYNRYKDWCIANGHMVKAANRFHKAFRTAMGDGILFEGQRRINGAPQRVYEFSDRVTTKWESPYPIDYDIEDFFAQIKM
jgi:P4 family phage/plasmid primase-like protien